jgi:hypothetical protein
MAIPRLLTVAMLLSIIPATAYAVVATHSSHAVGGFDKVQLALHHSLWQRNNNRQRFCTSCLAGPSLTSDRNSSFSGNITEHPR